MVFFSSFFCYFFVSSKRIGTLGMDAPEPPSNRTAQLQRMIRTHASNFLQQHVMGLTSLPTEEELAKLREAKLLEAQRRIEEERRAAIEREAQRKKEEQQRQEEKKEHFKTRMTATTTTTVVPFEQKQQSPGWKPLEVGNIGNADDDPMVQQMNIIRSYIKQAKQAQKWDEVQIVGRQFEGAAEGVLESGTDHKLMRGNKISIIDAESSCCGPPSPVFRRLCCR